MKNFTQKFIGLLALVFTMSFTVNAQSSDYENFYNEYYNAKSECMQTETACMDSYTAFDTDPVTCAETNSEWIAQYYVWNNACHLLSDVCLNDATNSFIDQIENYTISLESTNYNLFQNQFVSLYIPITLNQGWNMFGYTCKDSLDAIEAFSVIAERIEIVKDEWGLAYLPSWDFNGLGSLEFGEGYQIKLTEGVSEFSFCSYGIIGVHGCTNPIAANYNPNAHIENNSCIEAVNGCTNYYADNYDYNANVDDGSCIISGCMNSNAFNYNPEATYEPENICIPVIFGCTNDNSSANTDDGSCLGCTYSWADNFDINAGVNDGSCVLEGCMDESAANYNPNVTNDNGMCVSDCSETITLTSYAGAVGGGGAYGQWAWFAGNIWNVISIGDIVYSSNGAPYTVAGFSGANSSQVRFSTNVVGVFTPGNTYQTNINGCNPSGPTGP